MTAPNIAKVLDSIVELLSAIEHERWSKWQRYLHSKGIKQDDGSMLIPSEYVSRWERQMSTHYDELPEQEKESDREQVRNYLGVIKDALHSGGIQQ